MRDTDPPTLSQVPWEHPGGRIPGGVPTWPEARAPHQPTPSVAPTWNGHPIVLGISLMANGVLLASLVGVLFLAQAGAFAPPSSSRPSAPQGSALGSSNATPTPSLTPASGRLQVAPTSVQLGCDGGQQTQVVVLTNSGPEDVQWQVALDVSTNQSAVTISPRHGDLRAGTSVSIQIQNRNYNSAAQQGVIRFEPQTPTAEPAPSLSYTSSGCQGG
jgi:hypothetical protein